MIDAKNDKQYRALKRAYNKAIEENKEQFVFEGSDLLTTYCKYLLKYVEDIRKKPKKEIKNK